MKKPKRCNCPDIPNDSYHKISAVIIKNNKIIVVKRQDLDEYISLGGKHEQNETAEECLERESLEELNIKVKDPHFFGRFTDKAITDNALVILDAYLVQTDDLPKPTNEIEGFAWVGKNSKIKIASLLEKFLIPELAKKGLIR